MRVEEINNLEPGTLLYPGPYMSIGASIPALTKDTTKTKNP